MAWVETKTFFGISHWDKAAGRINLPEELAGEIIVAADEWTAKDRATPLRKALLECVGLDEKPSP